MSYTLQVIFWISLFIIFYSYLGYGILLWFLVRIKKWFKKPAPTAAAADPYPAVALVVAAYNEEDFIEQKITNTLELDYPESRLELIFITDGSSDRTAEIIARYPRIKLLHQPERRGKVAAMNRAIQQVQSPLVIFCDANTLLNRECITNIVQHYADPKVGGVAGEKRIWQKEADAAAAAGEGLYWKYESFLKKLDSDLYTAVGAAGELFSVRKALFEKAPEGTIIEDFVQSLKLCVNGYVVRYEPNAYAAEAASASIKEEMKRKVRICAGAFQAMILLKELFNVFRYPVVSFQFISHRILRWTLCPVALITLLLSNIALVIWQPALFYEIVLGFQVVFYVLAITGWIYASRNIRLKAVYIPFYFLFMNLSVFMGFSRFIRNKQTVLWEKAARSTMG
ncbi:MAG: glycosyltransferase family 2 protein [Candidatus Pseudobacter hemicellulosilyticus]|uniref:Glycosyltransferase family 2 protein n=1 Tax=Candidatus Pseudobacter hemicellulosilyticus TaxID=3121375 RepID=A0AAJ5WQC7_9BACT|nr:MAG: glycosyltransferase family 2 protein [Pseudobacter sp.]